MYVGLTLAAYFMGYIKCPFWEGKYLILHQVFQKQGEDVLHSKCPKFGKMSCKNPLLSSFTDFVALTFYNNYTGE